MNDKKTKKSRHPYSLSIVSSKIRIVRNISEYAFIPAMSQEKKNQLEEKLLLFFKTWGMETDIFNTQNLTQEDKIILEESGIASHEFIKTNNGKIILSNEKKFSISILIISRVI